MDEGIEGVLRSDLVADWCESHLPYYDWQTALAAVEPLLAAAVEAYLNTGSGPDYKEALAWLRGERSSVNWLQNGTPEGNINAARFDAATTEKAYWVVRAHQEGLIKDTPE